MLINLSKDMDAHMWKVRDRITRRTSEKVRNKVQHTCKQLNTNIKVITAPTLEKIIPKKQR